MEECKKSTCSKEATHSVIFIPSAGPSTKLGDYCSFHGRNLYGHLDMLQDSLRVADHKYFELVKIGECNE